MNNYIQSLLFFLALFCSFYTVAFNVIDIVRYKTLDKIAGPVTVFVTCLLWVVYHYSIH